MDVKAQMIIPDSLLNLEWEKEKVYPPTEGCDSLVIWDGRTLYFNVDSMCHHIATREFSEILEDLRYFYFVTSITDRTLDIAYRKMMKANENYKSPALAKEIDIMDVYRKITPSLTQDDWEYVKKLLKKYEQEGDLQTKLRIMQRMLFIGNGALMDSLRGIQLPEIQKVPVIELMNEILSTLEELEDQPYEYDQGYLHVMIGLVYYRCRYYDKAIPLFEKAARQSDERFFTSNAMVAKDYLGSYYALKGDYERSDSIYLSMLSCPYNVNRRSIYDVIAIGAIANNANARGNKQEAMRLYTIALPRALQVKDITLAGGYAVGLGRLYMEKGELGKARELIDSARVYLIAGGFPIRNWEKYYALARDYYLKTNDIDKAALYIDSVSIVKAEEEKTYNFQFVAYAEQQVFEKENALKEEKLQKQKTQTILISVILFLSLIISVILICSYKKLQQKNRNLYLRIKEQDAVRAMHERILLHENTQPTAGEVSINQCTDDHRKRELYIRVHEYLLANKNFALQDMDVNTLVTRLSTNRTYLFEVLKTFTGKSPQEYIRHLRLQEAKRLLESTDLLIEDIAITCGFSSVRTLYRQFQACYNLSPSAYRKVALEQKESGEEDIPEAD